jgi:hypothetical protein
MDFNRGNGPRFFRKPCGFDEVSKIQLVSLQ